MARAHVHTVKTTVVTRAKVHKATNTGAIQQKPSKRCPTCGKFM